MEKGKLRKRNIKKKGKSRKKENLEKSRRKMRSGLKIYKWKSHEMRKREI